MNGFSFSDLGEEAVLQMGPAYEASTALPVLQTSPWPDWAKKDDSGGGFVNALKTAVTGAAVKPAKQTKPKPDNTKYYIIGGIAVVGGLFLLASLAKKL